MREIWFAVVLYVLCMVQVSLIKISHAHEIVTSGLKENLYICIHLVMSDLLKQ